MAAAQTKKYVLKSDGSHEEFSHAKLRGRIMKAMSIDDDEASLQAPASSLMESVLERLEFPVRASQIDAVLAETASQLSLDNPIYYNIAIAIERESIYKDTCASFSTAMQRAWRVLSPEFIDLVKRHAQSLDRMIDQRRDQLFSHAALNSFKRTYALRDNNGILERPQHMFLRTALQVHGDDLHNVRISYNLLSTFKFMPSSPILFKSGTPEAQLSSCFLIEAERDIDTIFDTLSLAADISRRGGGIGLGLQSLAAQGSNVEGAGQGGLVPVLKMLDAAVEVVDQASDRRSSAICVYVEPWHADILSVVRMRRITGADAAHTDRLFYGLWINDLFMHRVHKDLEWSLFCPSQVPHLAGMHGFDFDEEYERLEMAGLARSTIRARDLWKEIILSQIESGGPFIMYKDTINEMSNERHLGTITHGNLCTEIVQKCDDEETAVCTLSSIVLPSFVRDDGSFDFASLEAVVRHVTLFLNCVIHETQAPTNCSRSSMLKNRALGIGIQGLADTFAKMGFPFDSEEAFRINVQIAETIYYSAVDESCNLIKIYGTYPSFKGSPISQGWLQIDSCDKPILSNRYDWSKLRKKAKRGIANSLLIAYMPTAGTTQLTGCSEGFEPYHSLIAVRKVQHGEFTITPLPLVNRLQQLDLWNEELVNLTISNDGSIQSIENIPQNIRSIFKTAWDIDQSVLVKMAAARAPFICQSQSMSLFFKSPSISDISRSLFLGWRLGLKTGIYYLRTKAAVQAIPVTLPVELWSKRHGDEDACMECSA